MIDQVILNSNLTITEKAVKAPELSTLVKALQLVATGVHSTLLDHSLCLLLPMKYSRSLHVEYLLEKYLIGLREILLYHIVSRDYYSRALATFDSLETADKQDIKISVNAWTKDYDQQY